MKSSRAEHGPAAPDVDEPAPVPRGGYRSGIPPDLREPVGIRPIPAADTATLRGEVLRPGQPPDRRVYAGDDDPRTLHLGAFDAGEVVGIASLYREDRADGPAGGWRLRGMATSPAHRGRGAGRALLDACVDHAAAQEGSELWCNARMVAVEFYRRAGFAAVGEQFDIPGIGGHVVMRRTLQR